MSSATTKITTTTTTMGSTHTDSASALFELFESSIENKMYQGAESERPRQLLGESVFNQFVKLEQSRELPMLEDLEAPELSPSVGTVTPLQLHSSVVESFFSPPSNESTPPLLEEAELDSENWTSLFEPGELELTSARSLSLPVSAAAFSESESVSRESLSTNYPVKEQAFEYAAPVKQKKRTLSPEGEDFGSSLHSRKMRSVPLSPVVYSEDSVSQKRARNTEAARRSRARKAERMQQLEEKVEDLTSKNESLVAEVARLRAMLASQ